MLSIILCQTCTGPCTHARPPHGDSAAHPSSQGTPMRPFRTLLPKQLPAPLPQPCQQPGRSLESSALRAARRKLLFAREAEPGRGWRAAGGAKPGSCAGEQAPAHPRVGQSRGFGSGSRCVLQDWCWDVRAWAPPFPARTSLILSCRLGASSEPLCPNPPSSGSLRSRRRRVAVWRGEKSRHQSQRERGR